jgi:CheY-like chemotaxis protein
VKESGGASRVASEVGRGTTFEIFFPRRDPGVAESQRDTHSIMGHGHVLVVDDEIALTNLARDGLERLGYRVTVFNDPTDALAAFEASPMSFDVVVTDMTMPKLTGDLLAIAIKRIRPDLPVILLSGFSDRITPERVKDAGIDSLGEKPLRPTALARLIAQLRNNR